jgi:small-conductance mechanosensitive channel
MERVAEDHPGIVKQPKPIVLLTRVGPDWMGFELHAATDRIENWMEVRSDLALAVVTALKAAGVMLR